MDELIEAICKQSDSGIHPLWYKNESIFVPEFLWKTKKVAEYDIEAFCSLGITLADSETIVIHHPSNVSGRSMEKIWHELNKIYKSVNVKEFYENPIVHGGPGWNFQIVIQNLFDK